MNIQYPDVLRELFRRSVEGMARQGWRQIERGGGCVSTAMMRAAAARSAC